MTRAALREASFYRRPNVRDPKRYHIVGERSMSACGVLLLEDTIEAADVPLNLRCQHTSCKSRWPAGVGGNDGVGEVDLAAPVEKLNRCPIGCGGIGQCKAVMHGMPSKCFMSAAGVSGGQHQTFSPSTTYKEEPDNGTKGN